VPGWGKLQRFGRVGDLSSKVGLIAAGKELVERCGRRARPDFKATFFRAGAYDVGGTLFETAESMDAVRAAGLCVTSDALEMDGITESLGRVGETMYSFAGDTPWIADHGRDGFQALPLRTRDFPVYSVVTAARRYKSDRRILERLERNAGNVKCVIAIDHEIEIGSAKTGGRWDDLSLASGDWAALAKYLDAVARSKILRCCAAQDIGEMLK
jgi:hypothetical protein